MVTFARSKYEADNDDIYKIRLATETAVVAGTVPGGAVTQKEFVKVSKSNREYGLRPRGVRLRRNINTPALPIIRYKFLPLRSKADAGAAAYAPEAEVQIGGITWIVNDFVAEDA